MTDYEYDPKVFPLPTYRKRLRPNFKRELADFKANKIGRLTACFFICYVILDVITTFIGITYLGKIELNPLVAQVTKLSPPLFLFTILFMKLGMFLLIKKICFDRISKDKAAFITAIIITIMSMFIVEWNLLQIAEAIS